jgi:hypothetical protein
MDRDIYSKRHKSDHYYERYKEHNNTVEEDLESLAKREVYYDKLVGSCRSVNVSSMKKWSFLFHKYCYKSTSIGLFC